MVNVKTRAALRWAAVDSGGWQYLVGALPSARVLCYDAGAGATALLLAGLCRELVVLHADTARRREIQSQAELMGLSNIQVCAPDALQAGVAAKGGFDGFVLHDPQALLLHRGNRAVLAALLDTLRQTLHPGAFVYFGLRHRYGYDRLQAWRRSRHDAAPITPLWSVLALTRWLRSRGFNEVRRTPILLERDRAVEIIPAPGYSSVKNRFLYTERLKELILGRYGSRCFAPFYGLVAYRDGGGLSSLEQLLQYLCTHAIDGVAKPEQLSLKRYFVLNGGKVILSLGAPAARHGDIIVVLTHDAESARRREVEGKVLAALAYLPAALSARIPKSLHSMMFLGAHCFVLSELPGVTIDAPMPRLWRITGNAMQFLAELHAATLEYRRITADSYPTLFGDLFNTARECYPAVAARLTALEVLLRQIVFDREFPCVRFHGDYKIENVMVDEATDAVTGVIDWELSRAAGPPLLDLLYLLVYNRMIHGRDWLSAFQEIGMLGQRDPQEQALWDRYLQHIPIAADLLPALGVLFAIHHIGCRVQINLLEPGREREMCDMIQSLESVLLKQGHGGPA